MLASTATRWVWVPGAVTTDAESLSRAIGLGADVRIAVGSTAEADADRAAGFVKQVLGDLESADRELQDTVRTFVAEQCNASRAAARLYTHRNTLLRRLARADELLPTPLAQCTVNVAVALDVLRWCGQRMID